MAMTDSVQNKQFNYPTTNLKYCPYKNATSELKIPKGTITQSLISIKLSTDYTSMITKTDETTYVEYQDFIAWFVDDNLGGTNLLIVMRVDLGKDVPHWAFTTTVGAMGVWSMQSLMKLLN